MSLAAAPKRCPEGASVEPSLGTLCRLSVAAQKAPSSQELKWARLSTLWDYGDDREATDSERKGERFGQCNKVRYLDPKGDREVEIFRSETGAYSHSGLIQCGNAHCCPVCSEKKARAACNVLSCALKKHLAGGPKNDVWMATLTIPHKKGSSMLELKEKLCSAWATMAASHRWRTFRRKYGISVVVRAFESTFGANGWHPHFHVLLFVEESVWQKNGALHPIRTAFSAKAPPHPTIRPLISGDPLRHMGARPIGAEMAPLGEESSELEKIVKALNCEVYRLWEHACLKVHAVTEAQIPAFSTHGVHLARGDKTALYITKWGLADELTMHGYKNSTAFGLLDKMGEGDRRAGAIFMEFARATKGLAVISGLGKLRKHLDLSEEDIAAHAEWLKEEKEKRLLAEGKPLPAKVPTINLVIPRVYFARAIGKGWPAVHAEIERAELAGECEQTALIEYLSRPKGERKRNECEENSSTG